jgi:hypothetical protein
MEHFTALHGMYRNSNKPFIPYAIKDILRLAADLKYRAEIIGAWIYCFASPEHGLRLQAVGFWFSYKHNTYVYSGSPKSGPAGDETLAEIRARLGSQRIVKFREESK